MRAYKTEGIVIKRKNFGEADRVITVFSKKHGKIQIKAKGVRRITSRRSSHIELLNSAVFNIYQAKSLPILTEVELINSFSDLKNNLEKMGYAYHICELIDGLCAENQENIQIYDLINVVLSDIQKTDDPREVIHKFEISLLRLLGFYQESDLEDFDPHTFIENILERRLKSKQIIPHLL